MRGSQSWRGRGKQHVTTLRVAVATACPFPAARDRCLRPTHARRGHFDSVCLCRTAAARLLFVCVPLVERLLCLLLLFHWLADCSIPLRRTLKQRQISRRPRLRPESGQCPYCVCLRLYDGRFLKVYSLHDDKLGL